MDMDAETFHDLALKVLAGEATGEERRALETECGSNPAHRDEFEQLKVTYTTIRLTAPMTEAVRASTPELPEHRRNELRTAVRQHFGPAAARQKQDAPFANWIPAMRWLFAGSGIAAIGFAVVIACFANRTIEVGMYGSDTVRGEQGITASDVPAAKLVTFDRDAPFDAWQNAPLAWNERAKIWVDNERDVLHVEQRVRHGQIVMQSLPLAPSVEGQREQIKSVIAGLER
jgi:ferric-dicitrate binding protein FerR (iron transport regulator)